MAEISEAEFIERVHQKVSYLLPMSRRILGHEGSKEEQTFARIEAFSFLNILAAMLDKIGKPVDAGRANLVKPPPIDEVMAMINDPAVTQEDVAKYIENHRSNG